MGLVEALTARESLQEDAALDTDPGAAGSADGFATLSTDSTSRTRLAKAQGLWPLRRRLVVAVLSPTVFIVLVASAGGWAPATSPAWTALVALTALVSASTLATYLPLRGSGQRLDLGCTPCAAVAAVSVLASLFVLSSEPHDVPTAVLAVGISAFGLLQRLKNPATCPA